MWKDGVHRRRYLCRACGRTFNHHTATLLHALKKRTPWADFTAQFPHWLSVRRTAALLGVRVATAFRWRHRLLAALTAEEQQPRLTGHVNACEAYIRYSEKGSRTTAGPGAYGRRSGVKPDGCPPFHRFRDGKPSCVLVACAGEALVVDIVGRGRPTLADLQSCLHKILGAGATLSAHGLGPFEAACRPLDLSFKEGTVSLRPPGIRADRLRDHLDGWLARFHGVATRYLPHYLTWFRATARLATPLPVA